MCEKLSVLRGAVCRYAAGFDPALVSGAQADAVMSEAAAIESAAAALKALAATRVAETSQWRGGSDRSAAQYLARKTGSSVSAAAQALKTAERLKALPAADAAARRGELSADQAAAVACGASADPDSEAKLITTATKASLQELRDEAARVRASAGGEDAEARHRRNRARRSLRSWTDEEGMWHLHYTNTPDAGAALMAVLEARRDQIFRQARRDGRREPYEAYGADALDEVVAAYANADAVPDDESESESDATAPEPEPEPSEPAGPINLFAASADDESDAAPAPAPEPPGPKPKARPRSKVPVIKALLRLDFSSLVRGHTVGEEVCEIAGFGPVPVSVARELIESGSAVLAAVVTNGVAVTGVAHLRRPPNAHQRSALEWLYPTCAVEGCSARLRLQHDHRLDWADTHFTAFDLLDKLCGPHHDLKTRQNWALVQGVGKRAFVPPSDPRHPRNTAANPAGEKRPPPPAANDPPEAA